MKITVKQLRRIIKEEVAKAVEPPEVRIAQCFHPDEEDYSRGYEYGEIYREMEPTYWAAIEELKAASDLSPKFSEDLFKKLTDALENEGFDADMAADMAGTIIEDVNDIGQY